MSKNVEKFDIHKAIRNKGNCNDQYVDCIDCPIGRLIHLNNQKARPDDLCHMDLVYTYAKILKDLL